MKKTLFILLCAALLLPLLAGCGDGDTPTQQSSAATEAGSELTSSAATEAEGTTAEMTRARAAEPGPKPDDSYPKLTGEQALAATPRLQGREPDRIKDAGDGATQLYYAKATGEELASYVADLQAAGLTCEADRTVGSNRFTSYVGNGLSVTAYYTDTNKTLRIITEPQANYLWTPALENPSVTTPMLTMIGCRFSNTSTYLGQDSGAGLMCFLIRLSDGSFIVIDGGVGETGLGNFPMSIYGTMLEQAPDKKNIRVAAWILTHSHGDHVGGFKSFVATYSKVVKIERLIYNFPCDADYDAGCDETAEARTSFRAALKTYCSNVPVYKMHTGQQYRFADALVEVYYTQEDFITKTQDVATLQSKNWNNTSCIFSVDIAGQRIMFLGDCQKTGNNQTAKIYGDYLKSDIVQIAHHGGVGGTDAIYKAVDARVGLFTTNDPLVPVYISKWEYNDYAVNKLHMQEYFNSCDRITTFALPYTPKSTGFNKSTKN